MEIPPKHPQIPSIAEWIAHLDGMISGVVDQLPIGESEETKRSFIDEFRDEFGSRQATDGAILSRVLGVKYLGTGVEGGDVDNQLWEAVHDMGSDWTAYLSESDGLVDPKAYAIEHRTQIELCALHALWILGGAQNDRSVLDRIDGLIDWHTRELQPDNGINRPWGLHAFVARSVEAEDPETRFNAMLHAQTLANNCCITLGRPDRLSAVILLDSANALRGHV